MNAQQVFLLLLLLAVFAMLLWGRIRYDLVAFGALVVAAVGGAVPAAGAFAGFGHPATVIIALVLVVSRGLANSGAVEMIARYVIRGTASIGTHIGIVSAVGAALSGLMNNVAALALLMPVDMEAAAKAKRSPALTLMPLSFATILGGMVTMIGTPPNIVVATFRGDALGEAFGMFDFAAVGLVVALVGVAYVALVGWRLLPAERRQYQPRQDLQDLEGYVAEARVPKDSAVAGERMRDLTRWPRNTILLCWVWSARASVFPVSPVGRRCAAVISWLCKVLLPLWKSSSAPRAWNTHRPAVNPNYCRTIRCCWRSWYPKAPESKVAQRWICGWPTGRG